MDQEKQQQYFRQQILPILPPDMKQMIQGAGYHHDKLGCSAASVYVFDHGLVLKTEDKSPESDGEYMMLRWLKGKLPVPEVRSFYTNGRTNYILMTQLKGRMLCDQEVMADPNQAARILARGLKKLWQVDITGCPGTGGLSYRLERALFRVKNDLVDRADAEPETFGANGFPDAVTLYEFLEATKPKEEEVLVHGDYCLPNLFTQGEEITGYLDLGFSGIGDKWQDIALGLRSLRHNLEETDRMDAFADASRSFFQEAGIVPDLRKIRYYQLLDELF